MPDHLQAARDYLVAKGHQIQAGEGGTLAAIFQVGGRRWFLELVPENVPQLPGRLGLKLFREDNHGEPAYWVSDHFDGFKANVEGNVKTAIAYSILDDPGATDGELMVALATVGDPSRRGQVGYMGNRMDVAVLADVLQRLLERVRKLESR